MKIELNISNLISLFRLLLSIPLCIFLVNDEKLFIFLIFLIAYISDMMDGFIARSSGKITEFGKMIDPLADKIFISTAVITLIIIGKIPLWFAISVLARDLLIIIGGYYAKSKLKYFMPSNIVGKITVTIIGIAILGAILEIRLIMDYGYYIAFLMMILSLLVYFFRMNKELTNLRS